MNKKGFASTAIVYTFLLVFLLTLLSLLSLYSRKSRLIDSIVMEGKKQLEETVIEPPAQSSLHSLNFDKIAFGNSVVIVPTENEKVYAINKFKALNARIN